MKRKLWCDECGEWKIPVAGVTAFRSQGYWWCSLHAKFDFVDGKIRLAFPSPGKLIPKTILTGDADG